MSGQRITVTGVTLSAGATMTITYGSKASGGPGATASSTTGGVAWSTLSRGSSVTGTALAQLSWDILWENALPAIDAVANHLVTPAVEKVVEANTLLSGLGFESGGLAAAHAIHNGLTAAPQTHGLTHGQKVNIGSVTQLVLEGAPTEEIEILTVMN